MMKLLRVDMSQLQVQWEPVPEVYEQLGGQGPDRQAAAGGSPAHL